ncbi:hypothetical protein FOXB_15401 [Fusarium oxysporum f. sp. conglutinans Fo5176]|uniref:Uncharacterized protein n=1 Tax=Fusarium oxysporum (strain Fo5176) TaxID=660025 RepID=F9G9R9_FUSOF|nr:hypothetical protein FOXB_15401 [Fusarium oxysporum f. sp. conglutinans Fo5176]
MAIFKDLPVELIVTIMKYIDTPQDLSAMIHADPWLLHCLVANKKQVIKPHIENLLKAFGGHVSTASLLAARLRHAKQDPGFNGHMPHHREQMLSPILRAYINGHGTHRPFSHRASLATICALSTLAIDVGWLTTSYISQARAEILKYLRSSEDLPEVSPDEHQRFINTACRFESYVQAFFHIGQPLFARDMNIRYLLFSPSLCGAEGENDATDTFYSIAYYIYDQHCTMMQNIMSSLRIEVNKYVHYLTSQGLGMLLQLQSMTLHDQLRFVLWTFESILDSPYPNILIVHGIELYKIGTVEKHSWNPWVHYPWPSNAKCSQGLSLLALRQMRIFCEDGARASRRNLHGRIRFLNEFPYAYATLESRLKHENCVDVAQEQLDR